MRVESERKQCVVGDIHREGRGGVAATRGVGECETLVRRAGYLCGVEESVSTGGGSSLPRCFDSQAVRIWTALMLHLHSRICFCHFLLSPGFIRLFLVWACGQAECCGAGLQLWFLKWPSEVASEELCCDWVWASVCARRERKHSPLIFLL